jgi:hypothetical protein
MNWISTVGGGAVSTRFIVKIVQDAEGSTCT